MQVFLSHSAVDSGIAHAMRALIERCSLGRVSVWFSSDTSSAGGMTPGGPWFDQLVSRISSSSTFVALITPNSAQNLWLHYEVGCAAMKGVPIMPLLVGTSVRDVGLPMALYNMHSISQPTDLKNFLMKLFAVGAVPHDEAMLETPAQRAAEEILRSLNNVTDASPRSANDGYDRILRLMDKRFMDLIESLPKTVGGNSHMPAYSVPVRVIKDGKQISAFEIDIDDTQSVQSVANACYFKIERHVSPYRYLSEWIIRDIALNSYLIMLDISQYVKASHVIRPGHEYELILLKRPFDVTAYRSQGYIAEES